MTDRDPVPGDFEAALDAFATAIMNARREWPVSQAWADAQVIEARARVIAIHEAEVRAARETSPKAKAAAPEPDRCKHGNDYHHCRRCDNEFDEEMS